MKLRYFMLDQESNLRRISQSLHQAFFGTENGEDTSKYSGQMVKLAMMSIDDDGGVRRVGGSKFKLDARGRIPDKDLKAAALSFQEKWERYLLQFRDDGRTEHDRHRDRFRAKRCEDLYCWTPTPDMEAKMIEMGKKAFSRKTVRI
jgi:hypothetical protein